MLLAFAMLFALAMGTTLWRVATPLDLSMLDFQMRFLRDNMARPAGNDVVVVGIDEAFLEAVREPVALMHPHLAKFLAAMMVAKPSVVGLDVVLPRRSFRFLRSADALDTNYDLILTRALFQAKGVFPIVLGKTWDDVKGGFRDILIDYVAAARQTAATSPADLDADPRASVIVCPDDDAVVRRFPGSSCQPDGSAWNLSSKMAAYAGNRQNWSGLIDYTIGAPVGYVALSDVLGWQDAGDAGRLAAVFRGRPVLLGPMLPFEDRHWVPVELAAWEPGNRFVPGVLIHAQALRSIMNTGLLQPVPRIAEFLLAGLLTLLWWVRKPWVGLGLLVLAAVAISALSTNLVLHRMILPVTGAILIGLCVLASRVGLEAFKLMREKNFLKGSFAGYVSPQVLREILAGRLQPGQRASRSKACLMFADIRGFTRRSESMHPEKLVLLLNRYFADMTDVIHKHHGTVDKFIGDGLMAFFGAPEPLELPEQNALEAAQEMLERLAEINREMRARGDEPLQIGIGIHTGEVVIGHIGSQTRHEYTAIGDVVNVASRLEGLTKTAGHAIVCSDAVAGALGYPEMLVNLGEQPVAGHTSLKVFGWNPALIAPA